MGKILFSDKYVREIERDWDEHTSRLTKEQSDLLFYIFEYITKAFSDDFDLIRKEIKEDVIISYARGSVVGVHPYELIIFISYGTNNVTRLMFTDDDVVTFMTNNPDINRSFLYTKIRQTIDRAATDMERYSEPDFDCTTLAHTMFMKQVQDFKYLLETDKKFKDWFDSIPIGGDKH